MKMLRIMGLLLIVVAGVCGSPTFAQQPGGEVKALKWKNTPLQIFLDEYSKITGRTLLLDPEVEKQLASLKLTLVSNDRLSEDEILFAMDSVMAMNQISVQKEGDKFLKVLPIAKVKRESSPIRFGTEDDAPLQNNDRLVNQLIQLKHLTLPEAETIIKGLIHNYQDNVQQFERTNSILLMDTEANIKRVLDVITLVDKPIISDEEPFIRQINNATASDIKAKLEEILTEYRQQQQQGATAPRPRQTGSPGVVPRSVRQLRPQTPGTTAAPVNTTASVDAASKGAIRGNVQIVADDRTNILIFITPKPNMAFFDVLIDALDIPTDPDVVVEVFALEFADAEETATMLNEFIGNASASQDDGPQGGTPDNGDQSGTPGQSNNASSSLREYVNRQRQANQSQNANVLKSLVGQLSADNIKILPDERTNSIMVMASKADVLTIGDIINKMDVMLSQVLIEAVILEVSLSDNYEFGLDFLQRSMVLPDVNNPAEPILSFAGQGGGGSGRPLDATSILSSDDLPSGVSGLTYYFTHFGLNIDAVMRAVSADNEVKIMSTPVILTTDNKPASITLNDLIYVFSGTQIDQFGNANTQTDQREVGLTLEVEPHINDNGFVMMNINQKIESVTGEQVIDGNSWPTISTRELSADIGVGHKETIILGGLVGEEKRDSMTGVPILSKLPIIGRFLGNDREDNRRTELIVLITPYVLTDKNDAEAETFRRARESSYDTWTRGWTDSKLAQPGPLEGREKQESDDIAKIEARLKARAIKDNAKKRQNLRSLTSYEEAQPSVVPPKIADPEGPKGPEVEVIDAEDEKWKSLLNDLDSKIDQ